MKKKFVFFALTLITSTLSFAQMKEGHIAYEIEVTSDNPDMEMAVMMFNGSKMNLYFGESHGRTDLEMGTMMSTTTVVNNNSGEVLILMGGIIGEKAVKTTTDVMEAETEEDAIPEADIKFTKEKKIIAGMQCKKSNHYGCQQRRDRVLVHRRNPNNSHRQQVNNSAASWSSP